ncbi:hypothetical protein FSW04_12330 [Baekduia soli]|uniref:Uncharacterized protein n=1 Tax=Baekduia soli TaxID=496014 RepID=A0A5B8U577_9ACTN|nr:hypothetical protein [Baekduia soli]QEC48276.1 hypothetical protein FSW04_12330 [Baekduia soli]
MSAQLGQVGPPHPATSHRQARINHVVRVLDTHRVLTRDGLYDLCHADHWGGPQAFARIVDEAIRSGRVRALGPSMLESVAPVRAPESPS